MAFFRTKVGRVLDNGKYRGYTVYRGLRGGAFVRNNKGVNVPVYMKKGVFTTNRNLNINSLLNKTRNEYKKHMEITYGSRT